MAEFDLSSLPCLVLEELFKMLPVLDRGHLASCNRRLSTFMHIASLWKVVNIDEFDLYTESIDDAETWRPDRVRIVGKLRARDLTMIEKYSEHFEKVKIVIHSDHIERRSLALLTQLSYRQVIKSISLRLDLFLSKVMNLKEENPLMERSSIASIFFGNVIALPKPGSGRMYAPASHIIDNLSPGADFTIALPPYSDFEPGFDLRRLADIHECTFFLYCYHMSENSCSRLKKLMLSPLPLSEEAIVRMLSLLRTSSVQLSPPPTAVLMSSFPNLQELHVNIVSLSDQLLLELSGASGGRKPLRRLVIRHIVCECEVKGISSFTGMDLFFDRYQSTFPQLSSAAWGQLARSSPSLTVECSVVSDKLPLLLDVIKPGTPLVRLEVLYRTTSSDDQSVLVLQNLSENHSRLTSVGVRFRACVCTSSVA